MATVSGRRQEAFSTSAGEQDIHQKIHIRGVTPLLALNI